MPKSGKRFSASAGSADKGPIQTQYIEHITDRYIIPGMEIGLQECSCVTREVWAEEWLTN